MDKSLVGDSKPEESRDDSDPKPEAIFIFIFILDASGVNREYGSADPPTQRTRPALALTDANPPPV